MNLQNHFNYSSINSVNSIESAYAALNRIDSNCSREQWIKIGMAAKSAGLSFEDFHNWSKYASNYAGEPDCKKVWNSFNESGGVTQATLFAMAKKTNGAESKPHPHTSKNHVSYQNKFESAFKVWERCLPAQSNHEYILRKHGKPDGLRYYPETEPPLVINGINVTGYLVVPCFQNYEIQTLQFIPPDKGAKKLNLPGSSFNEGYFVVGNIKNNENIYICEGLGQAWAANLATGSSAIVCFGAGRMMTVSKILHSQYPSARLVIVPDRGKEKQVSEIASVVCGEWVELPAEHPQNFDLNDYLKAFGAEETAFLLASTKAPYIRYKLRSGDELLNQPPMKWLVHGVLPASGLASLYGESGSGKSFLVLDMALRIAAGEPSWFGHRITKCPVTYLALEGQAGLNKRLKAWNFYFNKSVPDELKFVTEPFNLLCNDDVSELANSIIKSNNHGLIIIDTLNRAAPGCDENSSIDMGKIISASQKLQDAIGGVVLLVHHTGKDTSRGLRGHSSLYAALDSGIKVIKNDTRREWIVAKSKDDETDASTQFKLDIVSLGFDEYGDEITSCVVVPYQNIFNANSKRILPPKAGNQKIIWNALGELFCQTPDHSQASAPTGRPCIKLEDAIEKSKGRIICEPKRQAERTKAAITGLVSRGLLVHQDGWLWQI